MAITKNAINVTWPTAANTLSVAAAADGTSEPITIAADEVSGEFILVATSGGTNTGHVIDFYLLGSSVNGDYSTPNGDTGLFLGSLEMKAVSTTYRSEPISVPLGLEKYKIFAVNNLASGDAAVVDVELTVLNLE